MKKTTLALLGALLMITSLNAQTVDDGIKFIYYQRYKSAIETLEKVVASKPNDAYSVYWLGQAHLGNKDIPLAKAVYQKALTGGVNDPWLWVGMGHVELLEGGDANAAKQRFEQAITATKGKKGIENADILTAIGRANADGSSQQGDPAYGIEKLKKAATINKTNPDILVQQGICYLKMGTDRGGEAVESFRDATIRNPQYAEAYYRTGRIYQSQNNKQYMDEWYVKAINADPAYAPVYFSYFDYYEERDVSVAKEYLDKYVANSDKDCNTDYYQANYLFRAGKFQESLAKTKEMEAGPCKDFVRNNILYAYNYDRLNDSVQAKAGIDKFFATAPDNKIEPTDYAIAAKIYARFPGSEGQAIKYAELAAEKDTVLVEKIGFLKQAADIAGNAKMSCDQSRIYQKIMALKPKASATDFFYATKAAVDCKDCTLSDTLAKQYIVAYPDQPQGYSYAVQAAKLCDPDTTKGLAVEPIIKYNEILSKDLEKNKTRIYGNLYYLLAYYNDYAKDYQKSFETAKKILELMPEDKIKELLPALEKQAQQAAGNGGTGNKTGTNSSNGSKSANN